MKKRRTKYRNLSNQETKDRNRKMLEKFKKLQSTGRYGAMELYQMLGDEFDIEERNSVGAIIRKMLNEEQKEQKN